jgi:hypothetical protein
VPSNRGTIAGASQLVFTWIHSELASM